GAARPFVAACPDLAVGRAEVEADRVEVVGAHRLALDGPPGLLGRKAAVLALPRGARVPRHVERRPPARARARPDLGAVHRTDPRRVGISRVERDREADVADVAGHRIPDAHPGVAGPVEAVDTAVVLLPEAVGAPRVELHAVGIVAELDI